MKTQIKDNMQINHKYRVQDKAKVKLVEVSDNGKRMAFVNQLDEIIVYDILEKQPILCVAPVSSEIISLKYDRNGDYVFAGKKDGMVYVYSSDKGQLKIKFSAGRKAIVAMDISYDNKILLTAGRDNIIKMWLLDDDTKEYRCKKTYKGQGIIKAIKLAPDCVRFISASIDKPARLWRLDEKSSIHVFSDTSKGITDVDITSDGKEALFTSLNDKLITWTIKPLIGCGIPRGYICGLYKCKISFDKRYIMLVTAQSTVQIIDMKDRGKEIHSFTELTGDSTFAFSNDASTLLVSSDNNIDIYDTTWDMIEKDVDQWDDEALPHIRDFILYKKMYSPYAKAKDKDVEMLMKNLAYAGYDWINKETVLEKIEQYENYFE